MNQKLEISFTLILYISATTQGYGVQRAWTPMSPPFHQYGTYDEVQVDEPFQRPGQVNQSVETVESKIGIEPVVPSTRQVVQEYPVSPSKYLSRVIVSQSSGSAKEPVIDKDKISFEKLKIAPVPMQKVEESKEAVLQRLQIPLEEVKETETTEKAQLPTTVASDFKDITSIPQINKGDEEEAVADNDADLKDALTRIIVSTLEKMQDMQILDKAALPLQLVNELNARPTRQIEDVLIGVPAEKMETMKNILIGVSIEKMESMKNALINVPVDKMESMKDALLNVPVEKMESMKDALMNVPIEKMESMKDALMNVPIEKMESMKDALINVPVEKMESMKDALMNVPVEKMESMKNALINVPVEKMESMKNALINVPVEKMESMKDALMNVSIEKMESMKDALMNVSIEKMESMKDALMNVPAEKMESMKDALMNVPVEKMESMKDALMNVPIGKMESMKDALMNVPVEKMESMKNALINVPIEKMESMKDALMNVPAEKMESMKNALINIPVEKMEPMKNALIDVPVEMMESMKNVLIGVPVEEIEGIKDATIGTGIPMGKFQDMKDVIQEPFGKFGDVNGGVIALLKSRLQEMKGVMFSGSPEKMEDMKDSLIRAPAEKIEASVVVQIPMEKTADLKDNVVNKDDNDMKEMELTPTISKPENTLGFAEDLKDVVFTAFTPSIMGDRKEYFKHAIGKMNKEELDDLHDALLSVFKMKQLSAPQIQNLGHVVELKNAVHELVLTGSTNKKESFSEIEKVFEEVKDPKEALPATPDTESSAATNNDPMMSMLPSPSNMDTATLEKSDDEVDDIFDLEKLSGMQNMRRRRRWGMRPSARFDRGMFHSRNRHSGGGWGRGKRSIYGVGTTAQELHNFFPPAGLRIPMKTGFRQINSAAPPDPYPRSKESLNLPLLSINEVATDKIMDDIKEGLKYVLQTRNDFTLAIHGSATTGCHAVLDNLIEGGDKVLVLINGYWSELMANMSERLGAQVVRYNKSPGSVFTLDEIQTALRVHRPDIVLVVQGESSTTVRQPLEGVGDLCEKNDALLVVDVVAVAGMQPVLMDKYKMDAVFTSSNKGLGGVCGLAPISLSPRAVQKMKTRLTPPRAYQTDLVLQAELWNTTNPDRTRFQSMSLPLFYSLREALATIVEERIENTFKRHELTSEHLNRGLNALGLENFVEDPEHRLIGITAVKVPNGKDAKKVASYMFKNYHIEISSGFGPTAGKVLRMAIFASNADTYRTSNILRALKNALNARETSISY